MKKKIEYFDIEAFSEYYKVDNAYKNKSKPISKGLVAKEFIIKKSTSYFNTSSFGYKNNK